MLDLGKEALTSLPRTLAGLPVKLHIAEPPKASISTDRQAVDLHLEYARLRLLRGFDDLLCLEGMTGVEHLPHQIETVRRVLRHFRGRVLLADEVGLGKTIEACLLLREFLLRGLVKRVLILAPAALVEQWRQELREKFQLEFAVGSPNSKPDFWTRNERVLCSLHLAKGRKHSDAITACHWDLVIVDEAHHCKNRTTRNWQLVNALKRRHLFLLTATPVQNNLVELYNLLTLLEPGHLKSEADFKKTYMTRGNPRDPRNRHRLRQLLNDVMIRNTRSLVHIDLPPRYAQTLMVEPREEERSLYRDLEIYLRARGGQLVRDVAAKVGADDDAANPNANQASRASGAATGDPTEAEASADSSDGEVAGEFPTDSGVSLSRMQLTALLLAAGSHPQALAASLARRAEADPQANKLHKRAAACKRSAKDDELINLLRQNPGNKTLIFANFRATLNHLARLLTQAKIAFTVFSGEQSSAEKESAVQQFRDSVPVMLCSEAGGEGRNLQFCNTLVNFDLPWNPMRIEQRVGRIHRYGQKREVFIFNLCAADTLESRILRLLSDKIHMFELVVGEVGSILGNLDGGDEFESLVVNLWLASGDGGQLDKTFDALGDDLLKAQHEYVQSKELDEALFGEDYQQ